MGAFRELVKVLYGLKDGEVVLLNVSLKECRSVLALKTRALGKKLVVAKIESFKRSIVDSKFFVLSDPKFCFMKELSNKGFEESQILAYMFRHLDAVVFYECLEKRKFI